MITPVHSPLISGPGSGTPRCRRRRSHPERANRSCRLVRELLHSCLCRIHREGHGRRRILTGHHILLRPISRVKRVSLSYLLFSLFLIAAHKLHFMWPRTISGGHTTTNDSEISWRRARHQQCTGFTEPRPARRCARAVGPDALILATPGVSR